MTINTGMWLIRFITIKKHTCFSLSRYAAMNLCLLVFLIKVAGFT